MPDSAVVENVIKLRAGICYSYIMRVFMVDKHIINRGMRVLMNIRCYGYRLISPAPVLISTSPMNYQLGLVFFNIFFYPYYV